MSLEPQSLLNDLGLLEEVEKATLRMVTQAIYDFRNEAGEFFIHEIDLVADIGEDITREAMDRMGTSTIPIRLFGKIDYKRARYVFQPEYSVRQALFVDSKAEKAEGAGTVTIQTAQTSMSIRQMRANASVDEQGTLPQILSVQDSDYLVTTIFVKYNYTEVAETSQKSLESISVTCLPNGMLQERYTPTSRQTFWLAGRNAPSRGEAFRARISLSRLKHLASWRVQRISLYSGTPFVWDE
jgi:hypothetical protein